MKKIETVIRRLNKIGIKIELFFNYPWIYLDTINNKKVIEIYEAEHGFTIAFLPLKGKELEFTNISEIFKLIRKYV